MAGKVLAELGLDDPRDLPSPVAPPVLARRDQWRENARWTREFLGPWVHRRVTGRSSGDGVAPKRAGLGPI